MTIAASATGCFHRLPALLAGLVLLTTGAAAEPPPLPSATGPRRLQTAITAVTVYADRAQVTRTGAFDLPSAAGRFVVAGLPGWIDEESVRATLTGASSARILDVVVERRFLAEASEEAVRTAEAAVHEASDTLAELADEEAVLTAEIAQLEAIRAFSLDKLPRDVATREVKVSTFGEAIDFVSGALRKNRKALRDIAQKRRALGPELQARVAARTELLSRAQREHRDVIIEVEGRGRATLTLTYLTPGATWEPLSELRASSSGSQASLAQLAQVVQTTGEDWETAALSFSTQRPAETLNVPEVRSLLLGAAGPGLGDVVGSVRESWGKAEENYVLQNEAFAEDNSEYRDNMNRQLEIQGRSAATFDTLMKRGTTAHYAALSGRPIRADGRPIRVPISLADFAMSPKLVAVPEASLNAVRTAELVNTGAQPVLPGKVALFVDGAFVGTSALSFVAPGERFATYLGVNDRVKLERTLDRHRSHLERGRKRTELRVSFVITAENLDSAAVTLELGDRVPVADVDSIEVDDVCVPDEAKRDSNGIVRWTAQLAPRSKASWRIEYVLEYDNDLLVRTAPNKAQAPAPARMLYEDIENLEQSFH